MQGGLSHEQNVCLSVRLSNAWIVTKRKKNLCLHSYTIWKNVYPSFSDTKSGWLGTTPYTWNFRPNWPRSSKKTLIFNRYSLVAPQPQHLAKKGQLTVLTLIESALRAFQWAEDEDRTLPLSPLKGSGSTTQNDRLSSKIALLGKEVRYKVYLCEHRQRQSYKTFTGLSIWPTCTNGSRRTSLTAWKFGLSWPPPSSTPLSNQ